MKIGSYTRDGKASYGVFTDDGVVDMGTRIGSKYPDLLSLIRADGLGEAVSAADGQAADFAIDAIQFLPLIPAPVNIYCAGVNYMDHVKETGREVPPFPTTFMKLQQSLVGHDQPIIKPKVSDQFDFEAEYCVVIGKAARHVDKANYRDHVAGYTCLLDGSIRDFQRRAVDQGKNFNRSSSVGPWLVTPDELPAETEIGIQGRLNGEVMQNSTIDQLIHDVGDCLSYYSQFTQLEPGDMISTGTPGGVGHARDPQVWMKEGDVFEIEITGIGTLRNHVVNE